MILQKAKKGALLSAKFSRKSPSLDTEIETFDVELRKLKGKHSRFLIARNEKGDELSVDVFPLPRDPKEQDNIATKKMKTMSPEEAAKMIKDSAPPKEKKKASPLSTSTSSGVGFKKKR
ncbi:MAG: hypothetical protein IT381_17810 [Deltaproteobacteria bacterium]|nr:hypothetical protein [Deltaproteobacteria bacterium]